MLEAITELGYVRNATSGELAAHWRRSGFATWLFHPAATRWYSKRGQQEAHPVLWVLRISSMALTSRVALLAVRP